MTISTKQKLNNGSEATGFCNAIASLGEADEQTRGFGTMLASTFAPGFATRSGLTSTRTSSNRWRCSTRAHWCAPGWA